MRGACLWCMQLCKRAEFKRGIIIECNVFDVASVAVMYGSDSTRPHTWVAKYSTSCFHVWILLCTVGLWEVHALFSPSVSLYGLGYIQWNLSDADVVATLGTNLKCLNLRKFLHFRAYFFFLFPLLYIIIVGTNSSVLYIYRSSWIRDMSYNIICHYWGIALYTLKLTIYNKLDTHSWVENNIILRAYFGYCSKY